MPAAFDPYYEWLGIPPKEQPANHYRLLGIALLESDPHVIETATEQRVLLLRTRQYGKHADESQKLLNEISAVRNLLLDPTRKAAYDVTLRPATAPQKSPEKLRVAKALPEEPAAGESGVTLPLQQGTPKLPTAHAPAGIPPGAKPSGEEPPLWRQPIVLVGAAGAIIAIIAVVVWATQSSGPVAQAPSKPKAPQPASPARPFPQPERPRNDPGPAREEVAPINPNFPAPNDPTPAPATPTEATPSPPLRPETPVVKEPVAAIARRPALPDAKQQSAALGEVRSLFSDELAAAKAPEQKRELALKFLKIAKDESAGSATQYAALHLGRELAIASLDLAAITSACEALSGHFDIDLQRTRHAALVAGLEAAGPIKDKAPLADAVLLSTDQLLEANEFEVAAEGLKALSETARFLKDRNLVQAVADRRKAGSELMANYRAAQPAFETLKAKPDDQAANLAVGRYYCFARGDFERGLPHLVKGGNETLATLAKSDMANPESSNEQSALGDGWFAAAASAPPAEKLFAQERAALWLGLTVKQAIGLERARVEKRLAELPEPRPRKGHAFQPTQYLDDLPEIEVKPALVPLARRGRHGPLGQPINWKGNPVQHSLLHHPPEQKTAAIEYTLDGTQQRFSSTITLLPGSKRADGRGGLITFRVIGDGKTLWTSRPIGGGDEPQVCDISVAHVTKLRLETQATSEAAVGYACWLEPKLLGRAIPSWKSPPVVAAPRVVAAPPIAPPNPIVPPPVILPRPALPEPPSRPAGQVGIVYLDEVPELRAENLMFPVGRRGKVDPNVNAPNNRVMWQRTAVDHALFTHPDNNTTAKVSFDLAGKFTRFTVTAAQLVPPNRENIPAGSPHTFRVVGDGQVIWTSREMNMTGSSQACDISVQGVRELRLEVVCPGVADWAWAAWLEPKLHGGPADFVAQLPVYLDELPEQVVAGVETPLLKNGQLPGKVAISLSSTGGRCWHGLFLQPRTDGTASIEYRLDGKYASFDSKFTISGTPVDAVAALPGSVTFRVLGDGRELYASAPMQKVASAKRCEVSVRDVMVLRLEVKCVGDSSHAWTTWLNPRLTPALADAAPVSP